MIMSNIFLNWWFQWKSGNHHRHSENSQNYIMSGGREPTLAGESHVLFMFSHKKRDSVDSQLTMNKVCPNFTVQFHNCTVVV
jgi:hypothetical protein